MTRRAEGREACGDVVRIVRFFEIGDMTTGAIGWSTGKFAVQMALIATDADMGACQGKRRSRVVIKRSSRPGSRVMTGVACCRKPGGSVRRIVRSRKIFLMAGTARHCRQSVIVVRVALSAVERGMHAGQRKPRRRMVEDDRRPRGRGMT